MSAIERLRLMASAQPWFGMRKEEWQPYADARAIVAHIDALTAKLAEAERERDAERAARCDRVMRAIANKQREIAGEPPMTDDHWYRINPWEAEALEMLANAAIAACFAEVQG